MQGSSNEDEPSGSQENNHRSPEVPGSPSVSLHLDKDDELEVEANLKAEEEAENLEVRCVKADCKIIVTDNATLREKILSLENEVKQAKEKERASKEITDSLSEKIKGLEEQKASLERDIEKRTQDNDSALKEHTEELESVSSEKRCLEAEVREYRKKVSFLETEIQAKDKKNIDLREAAKEDKQQLIFLRGQAKEHRRHMEEKEEKISLLQSELESTRQNMAKLRESRGSMEELRQQILEMETRRNQAIRDHQSLLQMLESSVTRRRDPPVPGSFPNGTTIERKFQECQEQAEELFSELPYLFSKRPTSEDYIDVLKEIFEPSANLALTGAASYVNSKRGELEAFLEDGCDALRHPNPLVKLFATSSMQRIVLDSTRHASERLLGECKRLNKWTEWACAEDTESELDGVSVPQYVKGLFDLYLFCRFSDPPCKMWPLVGDVVDFSRAEHKPVVSAQRKTAKPGDRVIVLFPGLYFTDSESESRMAPIVKPLVVVLSTRHEKRGNLLSGVFSR